MPVIGVTGSFGSGKSTVAGMFRRRGAPVFDADQEIQALLAGRGAATAARAVVKAFGRGILSSGFIDRLKLAALVFDDQQQLKVLTDILHPFVRRRALEFLRRHKAENLLVMDVPLLIESGWNRLVDVVVVVKASRRQQLERLRRRSGMTRTQALKRIRLQMPLREKIKFADYVVDNSGSQSDTHKQVALISKVLSGRYQKVSLIKSTRGRL